MVSAVTYHDVSNYDWKAHPFSKYGPELYGITCRKTSYYLFRSKILYKLGLGKDTFDADIKDITYADLAG